MSSVNKVILIGNLGADPETRQFPNGGIVCNLRIATTEKWKDKVSGELKEATEWHRVVMFRKLAEIASQYLRKGSSVFIEGRLQTRKWQDRDAVEHFTTEIEALEMQMLGSRPAAPAVSPPERVAPKPTVSDGKNMGWGDDQDDGDIPF